MPTSRSTRGSCRRLRRACREIANATGEHRDPRDVAEGFLRIAVANMANAIKQVSVQKGHDAPVSRCMLRRRWRSACVPCCRRTRYGHACSSIRSPACSPPMAWGSPIRPCMREQAVEVSARRRRGCRPAQPGRGADGEDADALTAQGAEPGAHRDAPPIASALRRNRRSADRAASAPWRAMRRIFTEAHRARFGFATPERALIVEAVAVEATAPATPCRGDLPVARAARLRCADRYRGDLERRQGPCRPGVRPRGAACRATASPGPALIREAIATTMVEPGWTAEVTRRDHLLLRRTKRRETRIAAGTEQADPVLLELFNNLFMSVAEQTGAVLQNTSLSVNIKERLDFSCAVFDAQGGLVANAPHVPVHLGAMGESVAPCCATARDTLKPGDVVALNNPYQRRHAPARRDRGHAGLRRGGQASPVLRRQPRPPRRRRRPDAGIDAACFAHSRGGRRGDRRLPAGRWRRISARRSSARCWPGDTIRRAAPT